MFRDSNWAKKKGFSRKCYDMWRKMITELCPREQKLPINIKQCLPVKLEYIENCEIGTSWKKWELKMLRWFQSLRLTFLGSDWNPWMLFQSFIILLCIVSHRIVLYCIVFLFYFILYSIFLIVHCISLAIIIKKTVDDNQCGAFEVIFLPNVWVIDLFLIW